MAEAGTQLQGLTECCICLKEFTDPRMLPCIHTFCLGCLKQTLDKTNPGGWDAGQKKTLPCPLCRQEFAIPAEGLDGLKKNFFMEHLMEVTQNLQLSKMSSVACDICRQLHEGKEEIKNATMRCYECKDNFCDLCAKAHTLHKSILNHHIVKIGCETEEDLRRLSQPRNCNLHNQKPLDYYCPQCKKVFCVSCVLENHSSHKCKDVSTVEAEFRQIIERIALQVLTYTYEICQKSINIENDKDSVLLQFAKTEREIKERQLELKELIDNHTSTLLAELSLLKQKQIKDIANEKEDIDRSHTILKSFQIYCTELRSKGSASDICGCVDELVTKANELEKDHEEFLGRPNQKTEVSLQVTNLEELLKASSGNIVGRIQESVWKIEPCVIITGLSNGLMSTKEVFKLKLHGPQSSEKQEEIPAVMQHGLFAAVNNNTLYVTGLGSYADEIWKYCANTEVWQKCATLVQGRYFHSAAFTDDVLYICGGSSFPSGNYLDSVEVYNSDTSRCTTVGKLVYCVSASGNCVPFKSSLYIFGGLDRPNDKNKMNCVQMYDTIQNACTLLSKPMPLFSALMQAVRIPWQTSVILIGSSTCFIFNLMTETWQERSQFKTDVQFFGLAAENGRLFVIGGGKYDKDEDGKFSWKCRDDVRYATLQSVIEDKPVLWKCQARLAEPVMIGAYGRIEIYSQG